VVKIGRNDPCPCGSGKTYKQCCSGKEGPQANAGGIFDELRKIMRDKEFGSLKEARAFLDWHTGQKNRAPLDDFQGLSPEQMHRFLHFPFSSPDLVAFFERPAFSPEVPLMRLFGLMISAIAEKGLKATEKGNIPLAFVRGAAHAYASEEERMFPRGFHTETEFVDLNVTRLTSGLAGLIRKYRGRFVLTAQCRDLMAKGGMSVLYPRLFRAFVEKYNWACRDRYPSFGIIQLSFLFSLLLFQRFASEWRPPAFYEDCFLKAFPAILKEAELEPGHRTPEEEVRSCYTWRCLGAFPVFLGLLEVEWEGRGIRNRRFTVRKSPLLDGFVTLHL
jgi:hypothetical protein